MMLGHRFRHRLTIQEPVNTQDGVTGEISVSWANVKSDEPSEALTGPGREFIQSGAIQSDTDARFTVRWFSGLTQDMRILWDGRTYDIKTFTTDRTGRKFYFIEGKEGVNDG